MKKLLILMLLFGISDAILAQKYTVRRGTNSQKEDKFTEWQIPDSLAEGWEVSIIPADELKGNEEYKAYSFKGEDANFYFWNNDEYSFKIVSKKGPVSVKYIMGVKFASVKYGFYDPEGKMISSDGMGLDYNDENFEEVYSSGFMKARKIKKERKEFLEYLINQKGYIRILISLYGGGEIDMKIPCLNK